MEIDRSSLMLGGVFLPAMAVLGLLVVIPLLIGFGFYLAMEWVAGKCMSIIGLRHVEKELTNAEWRRSL
jgi:hypothetical protein